MFLQYTTNVKMRLRSGRSTTAVVLAEPVAVLAEPAVVLAKPAIANKAEFMSYLQYCEDRHPHDFIGTIKHLNEWCKIFLCYFDELDNYDPSGHLKQTAQSRVSYWQNDYAEIRTYVIKKYKRNFKRVLDEIQQTNESVEALAQKFNTKQ